FAPYSVGDLSAPVANVALPEGVDERRLGGRLKALAAFNKGLAGRADPERVAEHERLTARAARFRRSPALKAFDLAGEKPAPLAACGVDGKKVYRTPGGRPIRLADKGEVVKGLLG